MAVDGLGRVKKLMLFRALQLGDLLVTVPAFRSVRRAFPAAEIVLCGLPWASEFVSRYGRYIDRFVEFPGFPGLPERAFDSLDFPRFLAQIQNEQFDLAIQMQGSGTISNPLVSLFNARRLAGHYLPGQYCPDQALFLPYSENGTENQLYLRLMVHLGAPAEDTALEFPIFDIDLQNASGIKSRAGVEGEDYICLHPGASLPEKRWPARYFAALGDAVSRLGYRVLVTGSESEWFLAQEVVNAMRYPAVNLAGQTSLGSLGALLKDASLLISNDTGVSHIADALNTPSIVLFISTSPDRWGPEDKVLHRCIADASGKTSNDVLPLVHELLVSSSTAQTEIGFEQGQKEKI